MKNSFRNVVEIAKEISQLKLNKGDIAVDCTMGNGNDTALLCSLVGEEGQVYAFDIQEQALLNTKKRLEGLNFLERATLIFDGHEHIDQYILDKVQLIIFNLGYLPGGNHEITTRSVTTLDAIGKCLELLRPNGVILLIIYPGHENGRLEKADIHKFTSALNQKEFNVVQICLTNQINNPPELICIEKV